MSLATLTGSKVSVIEAEGATAIQFSTIEAALSALVKHKWEAIAALDRYTVLFQHQSDNTIQHITQLKMAARVTEKIADRRAISRLALEDHHEQERGSKKP